MKISAQAILCFHQEVRRQLISPGLGPCRKVVENLARHTRFGRTVKRNLNIQASSLLRQNAPASVPQDESISIEPPLKIPFSSWEPYHSSPPVSAEVEQGSLRHLPQSCPGCGALTQEVNDDEAGFYTRSRRSVKDYIRRVKRAKAGNKQDAIQDSAEQEETHENEPEEQETSLASTMVERNDRQRGPMHAVEQDVPFCDRCHNLLHQSKGVPIAHPTIDSIAETIEESPFRHNHVYHVLDAADFPLSLVPSIFNRLMLARPRSQNRRSQHDFSPRTTVSFIITRSDLLAPQKEMVDSLMPYFTSVLREALGRKGEDMRLGNVHLVSAKRGWWTKEIKEAIYKRGGGNWMVGKFNVGKSNLFEVLFPKGHDEQAPVYSQLQKDAEQDYPQHLPDPATSTRAAPKEALFSESSLLPPPQPSSPYPTLPLVSPLPGTTASPIRLPFGSRTNAKGELIDLPGLPRGNLSQFVSEEHHRTLLMEHRPTVIQYVLKPGQSLLLGGGLMRITPITTPTSNPNDETIILAYPFTPLPAHVTSTEKAELTQLQQRESGIKSFLRADAGDSMKSAGIFALNTDVTKSRSGALLRAGVPLAKLPFRVKGTDILLEGVGWIELVCQVRHSRKRWEQEQEERPPRETDGDREGHALSMQDQYLPQPASSSSFSSRSRAPPMRNRGYNDPDFRRSEGENTFPTPHVEIFTPQGKSVGQRRTMGAWMLIHGAKKPGQRAAPSSKGKMRARPRRSMKGSKKREKIVRRAAEGGTGAGGAAEEG